MYNNPFFNNYNPQVTKDRIDNQIMQLQQMKEQLNQPIQPITQNFQLTPNNDTGIKYANDIEEVERTFIMNDTPFFSKDMSVVWIKNTKNEIKSYTLAEIIQKDNKDLLIESLQYQIKELKEGKEYAKSNTNDDDEPIKNKKSTDVSTDKYVKAK